MGALETNICEAIDILVNKALSDATFDKTIQGIVLECTDATIGKYKIKYQDSTFYAYSNNIDVTYANNTSVYILVPNNDITKDKTILGATDKLGVDFLSILDQKNHYDIIGTNCVDNNTFDLCSYTSESFFIYDKNSNINHIGLNIEKVNQYIKNSLHFSCGATFKTQLPREQQYNGNYGIIFLLNFADNATGNTVQRTYLVDINSIPGTPYNLTKATEAIRYFEIDGTNFIDIESIILFVKDFPIQETGHASDIFISNIQLCGAELIDSESLNSYGLSLLTPQGTFFTDQNNSLTIQGQMRAKGKVINEDSQSLKFYWFMQDLNITTSSLLYNKYGKIGWRCLNQYNKISEDEIEWIAAKGTFIINKQDVVAKQQNYKCVVVYNDNVISKEFTIKNLTSTYDLTIESDSGTQFYYDIGSPTLKCYVNEVEQTGYDYIWSIEDNQGDLTVLNTTTDLNTQYYNILNQYTQLKENIENGDAYLEANKNTLLNLEAQLKNFDKITRVEGNTIYKINVNTINTFSKYCCSVYNNGVLIGTAEITLTNSFDGENAFTVVINNGNKVYQYSEAGLSPANSAAKNPIDIDALSFVVYDNLGLPVDEEIIRKCKIQWIVPNKDTMLQISNNYEAVSVDLVNNNTIYENLYTFSYFILDKYNPSNSRNNIQLVVDYKGTKLSTSTNFVFLKQGENGSNGTDFICKIAINNKSGTVAPKYPVFNVANNTIISKNFTEASSGQWFKLELWKNGEQIFSGLETGTTLDDEDVIVTWNILKNRYAYNEYDFSCINYDATANTFSLNTQAIDFNDIPADGYPANIVQAIVEYNGKTSYATLPITIVYLKDSSYNIELKENTGFREVLYSSSGQNPQYDSDNPFEIIVKKSINGYIEDISTLVNSDYNLTYAWFTVGSLKTQSGYSWNVKECNYLQLKDYSYKDLEINQQEVAPEEVYSGYCVNNAVVCSIENNGEEIGTIHIPVYLYLNRYANENLNQWDGNSVQISEDGGFILAPQIGAGIKEEDNSFTGIVMGEVIRNQSGEEVDEIGLFGYHQGQRSIFLDADTGCAEFGVEGQSQIIIDPSSNTGKIQSGNYKETNITKMNSANSLYETGSGMMIDFTTPEIKFGNNNFSVTKDGYVTIADGADIAGWKITENQFYKNSVMLNTYRTYILDTKNTIDEPTLYWKITKVDSLASIVGNIKYAFKHIGDIVRPLTSQELKQYQVNDILNFGEKSGAVITVSEQWTVATTEILEDGTYPSLKLNDDNKAIIAGAGKSLTGGINLNDSKFIVDYKGSVIANDFTATLAAKDNNLDPIHMGVSEDSENNQYSAIYSGKTALDSGEEGFYLGQNGLAIGSGLQSITYTNSLGEKVTSSVNKFQINKDGTFFAREGVIGSSYLAWEIGKNAISSIVNGESKNNYLDGSVNGIYLSNQGIGLGKGESFRAYKCLESFSDRTGTYLKGEIYAGATPDDTLEIGTIVAISCTTYQETDTEGIFNIDTTIRNFEVIAYGNSPFYVTQNGYMVAKKGTLGPWTLSSSGITNENDDIYFKPSGIKYKDFFSVNNSGAFFKGEIEATGGKFSGHIEAESGSFDDCTMTNCTIENNCVVNAAINTSQLNLDSINGYYVYFDEISYVSELSIQSTGSGIRWNYKYATARVLRSDVSMDDFTDGSS